MLKRRFIFAALWLLVTAVQVAAQCSSLYTTPEFPIATHPSDQHTQSWGANIFTAAQMGPAANFTGVQVYVDNSFGPTTYANQQVWLRHTAVTSYPNAQYPTTTGFTQCFAGTYTFPMSGLYTISFNVAPFAYNGSSNVEILFENRSNVYRSNEPWFRRTTSYGAGVYRSKWNGNFGSGGFPGTAANGSAVRLTYTLSLTAAGGGGCGAILPVSFPDFAAQAEGTTVHCTWQQDDATAQTIVLERSIGTAQFDSLASFAGSASGRIDWVDAQPHVGTNIYRLRSRDADGTTLLSSMVIVDMADRLQPQLFCAPSGDGIDVIIDSPGVCGGYVEVVDLQGRLQNRVEVQLEAGRNHAHLPCAGAAGIYVVHAQAGDKTMAAKVMID